MNFTIKRTFQLNALLFLSSLFIHHNSYADNQALVQTKSQLKQIENKMSELKLKISQTHNKQSVINKELSHTEAQILSGKAQLKKIKQEIDNKQRQITALAQQVKILNDQLQTQQDLLIKHVRARYQMGNYPPITGLFNQDKLAAVDRQLIFNQYLVRSRQHTMNRVRKLKNAILLNQNKLHQELAAQDVLQQQLNKRQHTYDVDKRYRTALMGSLTRDIQDHQQKLKIYTHNKDNLARLLRTLSQKSLIQTRHPFTHMKRKLQKPVVTNHDGIQTINQGVVFFANEDTAVMSVFPGKVVFSDWLNGYGLLLILDHGRGSMTLYANNKSLIKHKGDVVNQGEKIATVGHSGTLKKNGLYFEIRQYGKAVNPLEWMS